MRPRTGGLNREEEERGGGEIAENEEPFEGSHETYRKSILKYTHIQRNLNKITRETKVN